MKIHDLSGFKRKQISLGSSMVDAWLWEKGMNNIKDEVNAAADLVQQFHQIILCGPPGTSKTWFARKLSIGLIDPHFSDYTDREIYEKKLQCIRAKENLAIVQFHPSYNYEDFVRGIQVSTNPENNTPTYKTVDRIFAKMAKRAKGSEGNFVLIIDEINRANLATVLGELIYALEYRDDAIALPYADESGDETLSVPTNLYLIGTMNTADRSIGHIDYAVRRRFAFVSLLPRKATLKEYYDSLPLDRLAPGLHEKAEGLFDAVATLFIEDPATNDQEQDRKRSNYLSPDFHPNDVQIGHTYFMAEECKKLKNKLEYQIKPILREYLRDGILNDTVSDMIERLEITCEEV